MKIGDSFPHKWGRGTILSVKLRGGRVVAMVQFAYGPQAPIDIVEIPGGESLRGLVTPAADHAPDVPRPGGAPASRNLVSSARAGVQA